ncbi:N-acyl amino acid synthase FeeM domain-containing protein [Bradyrhizobium oligotrophicum]|uniref:N-acyl amino acid synthase FeeM domain-containing protein n=1 Tax=Bradyrhizobium oligotrophicum TaxID=44255 RepID=UPI003EBB966C
MTDVDKSSRVRSALAAIRSGDIFRSAGDGRAAPAADLQFIDDMASAIERLDSDHLAELSKLAAADLLRAKAELASRMVEVATPRVKRERDSSTAFSCDYRLAASEQDKEDIYRLRYRAYLSAGQIASSADQRVSDAYDELPNSFTFGVYFAANLCGSIRINVLGRDWQDSFGDTCLS